MKVLVSVYFYSNGLIFFYLDQASGPIEVDENANVTYSKLSSSANQNITRRIVTSLKPKNDGDQVFAILERDRVCKLTKIEAYLLVSKVFRRETSVCNGTVDNSFIILNTEEMAIFHFLAQESFLKNVQLLYFSSSKGDYIYVELHF